MMQLSEHWPHSRHLENRPLDREKSRVARLRQQQAGFFGEVYEDGSGFKQDERPTIGSVMINNRGNFSVGIDPQKLHRILLPASKIDRNDTVWKTAFLQHQGNLG